jgi:hypothetical protein
MCMILTRNMSAKEIAYSSFFTGEMKKEASLSEADFQKEKVSNSKHITDPSSVFDADFQKEKVSLSLTHPLFLRLTSRRRR